MSIRDFITVDTVAWVAARVTWLMMQGARKDVLDFLHGPGVGEPLGIWKEALAKRAKDDFKILT